MNFLKLSVCWMLLFLTFMSCRKATFEDYYGRPDWLASPIYQQLDSMGDFKSFLHCIELAGYKNTLGSAGSWTVFAPTDAAFATYLAEQGISDLSGVDKALAEGIVRMSMVYDGERIEKLTDYFSQQGRLEGFAFRRRAVHYDFVEEEIGADGRVRKIVSTNRRPDITYAANDNNNKHLTFFFESYMSQRGLGAADYNIFYPNSQYTGLNVGGAQIDPLRHNIAAENGYIHVVDKVLAPEQSIDQYLRGKPQYSAFKGMLDLFATYTYNEPVTRRYEVLTGSKDSVFTKGYTSLMVSVNSENYTKEDFNDAQINNISITVPTNEAVEDFSNRVLLKYYPAGTTTTDIFYNNPAILQEFINSHLYQAQLWPSRFTTQVNSLSELPKISNANIQEAKLLSNGAFYGVDKAQNANVFQSVYGNVLLDPKYNLTQIALERLGLNLTLRIPTLRYMLILVTDLELNRIGFEYDAYNTSDPIRYKGAAGTPKMREVLQNQIIPLANDPIPDLSGSGILEAFSGEYVIYNNNTLSSSGTLTQTAANEREVRIDKTEIGTPESGPLNGIAVYSARALLSSEVHSGNFLKSLGAEDPTSPYHAFFNYLVRTDMWSETDGVINGVEIGLNYTLLIPNNDAIAAAVANGDLPANPATGDVVEQERIKRFIQYHIIRNTFAIDGKKTGVFETLCKDIEGTTIEITVTENQATSLQVRDTNNGVVSADVSNSNKLGQRLLVHSLNGYLQNGI